MPEKIIATGVLPGHDGESRAQRRHSVRFGLRQTSVQVRDRGTVRKVDGEERRSKELGQSRRQANANLHCLPYLPIPKVRAVYHEICISPGPLDSPVPGVGFRQAARTLLVRSTVTRRSGEAAD